MHKMKYRINLFGEGIRIWSCNLDLKCFKEMDLARNKQAWVNVLFDLDFLNKFGFSHWSELSSEKEQVVYQLFPRNSIEIKQNNKRLTQFFATDLIEHNLLFPLYQTSETSLHGNEQTCFRLLEFETGMIMSYAFEAENISMNDLCFQLSPLKADWVLSGVSYNSTPLELIKTDSVVRGSNVIFE